MNQPIITIAGKPGSGKSTVAKALAERLAQRLSLPFKSEKRLREAWQQVARDPAGASDAALDEILQLLGLAPAAEADDKGGARSRAGLFGRLNTTSVILALQWLELNKAALLAEWQAADSGV